MATAAEETPLPSDAPEPGPDFSFIPDTFWVRVMSMLSLQDRAQVALTCHTLNDVFNHPSLWHTVKIVLYGTRSRLDLYHGNLDSIKNAISMPTVYLEMVKRFGPYFQNLSLILVGYLHTIPQEVKDVIAELSARCRLEALTLQVGTTLTDNTWDSDYARAAILKYVQELGVIVAFVEKAFRLHSFTLVSWPLYESTEQQEEGEATTIHEMLDILKVLRSNPKNSNLEKLSLYWVNAEDAEWITMHASMPDSTQILKTITHFRSLTHLSLRFCMLSNELMTELSRPDRPSLQLLRILVTYSRSAPRLHIRDIQSESWKKFRERFPEIELQITFITRMPYVDKATVLKPEAPITGLQFMKYANCTSSDVRAITDKYKTSLKSFINHSMEDECDEELIAMATECSQLRDLVHFGPVHADTVKALAAVKSKDWHYFQMKEENISFENRENVDENQVIGRRDDGELYMVSLETKPRERPEREGQLSELSAQVSDVIGQKWQPVPYIREVVPADVPEEYRELFR